MREPSGPSDSAAVITRTLCDAPRGIPGATRCERPTDTQLRRLEAPVDNVSTAAAE